MAVPSGTKSPAKPSVSPPRPLPILILPPKGSPSANLPWVPHRLALTKEGSGLRVRVFVLTPVRRHLTTSTDDTANLTTMDHDQSAMACPSTNPSKSPANARHRSRYNWTLENRRGGIMADPSVRTRLLPCPNALQDTTSMHFPTQKAAQRIASQPKGSSNRFQLSRAWPTPFELETGQARPTTTFVLSTYKKAGDWHIMLSSSVFLSISSLVAQRASLYVTPIGSRKRALATRLHSSPFTSRHRLFHVAFLQLSASNGNLK